MERTLVTLIAANDASAERARLLGTHAAFLERPEAFASVYSAIDADCMPLARMIGDRLWLTPRFLSSETRTRALAELVLTLEVHRPDCTVLVVPERWLPDLIAQLACTRLLVRHDSVDAWLHELTLDFVREHGVRSVCA